MKIKTGILTSSRADYGIYKPLLSKLSLDNRFDLTIIAFGMHLQKQHGCTIDAIRADHFGNIHEVEGMPEKDSQLEIGRGYGQLIVHFSEYWSQNEFDFVFALGDRFEMSAAVQAGIPFGVNFSHLHGGETTLGAIDNIYRHQITLVSSNHFVATQSFKEKVESITGKEEGVYSVGALSLDGIEKIQLPSWDTVRQKFKIPDKKFILVTFHPETVRVEKNEEYCQVVFETLEILCKQVHIVITLSNADTMGSLYRNSSIALKEKHPHNISIVHSFGKEYYFTAMNASEMLLGNTSSGIVEAASFNKYVINVGDRQAGRQRSKNVIDVPFNKIRIIDCFREIQEDSFFSGKNEYYKSNTAYEIIEILANKRF